MIDLIVATLKAVIAREGGYVDNPHDPGGATCWGITEAVARANGYLADMKTMPEDAALLIYSRVYYDKPDFDHVFALSPRVASALVDIGVNQGVQQAISYLQRALNLFNRNGTLYPDVVVDCCIGPGTIGALTRYMGNRGAVAESVMLKALTCMQGARYIEIGMKNSKLEDFEFGWFANRVMFNVG